MEISLNRNRAARIGTHLLVDEERGEKPRGVIGQKERQVSTSPKRQLMIEPCFQEFNTPTYTHPSALPFNSFASFQL